MGSFNRALYNQGSLKTHRVLDTVRGEGGRPNHNTNSQYTNPTFYHMGTLDPLGREYYRPQRGIGRNQRSSLLCAARFINPTWRFMGS